jgi:arylsulfatase A-like enzyme
MTSPISRRDFLKLAGLLSLSYAIPQRLTTPRAFQENSNQQNVLIIVFDAWSKFNNSLYGYERQTSPNLERLAERAIVYHNNFSGGNFTTPGTASLLTGTLPWTHRALKLNGTVDKAVSQRNIFNVFNQYHRFAYTHNPVAHILLNQFFPAIDDLMPWESLYLESDYLYNTLFKADPDIAPISWSRAMKRLDGYSYSLYLSHIYGLIKRGKAKEYIEDFPRGLPNHDDFTYFILEQGIDWLTEQVTSAPQPFLGYYHFFPPHDPYHTRADFYGRFVNDNYHPPYKPHHLFRGDKEDGAIDWSRIEYDEFILYMDAEFARLYNLLEQHGILDNTWLVVTSDHGEMFERGILGHITEVLYQPVIQVPLLIFPPGQRERVDIYDMTSAIDLLPTLMQVTGQDIPDWVEGFVLPPFSTLTSSSERDVFSLHGDTDNSGFISQGTATLVRGNHKLIWYFGYEELGEEGEMIELYDIVADPDEMDNLYPSRNDLADELLGDLKSHFNEAENVHKSG